MEWKNINKLVQPRDLVTDSKHSLHFFRRTVFSISLLFSFFWMFGFINCNRLTWVWSVSLSSEENQLFASTPHRRCIIVSLELTPFSCIFFCSDFRQRFSFLRFMPYKTVFLTILSAYLEDVLADESVEYEFCSRIRLSEFISRRQIIRSRRIIRLGYKSIDGSSVSSINLADAIIQLVTLAKLNT